MKQKLELRKKTISVLSDSDLTQLNGGEEAAITTSFGSCTGFTCCDPTLSIKIALAIVNAFM